MVIQRSQMGLIKWLLAIVMGGALLQYEFSDYGNAKELPGQQSPKGWTTIKKYGIEQQVSLERRDDPARTYDLVAIEKETHSSTKHQKIMNALLQPGHLNKDEGGNTETMDDSKPALQPPHEKEHSESGKTDITDSPAFEKHIKAGNVFNSSLLGTNESAIDTPKKQLVADISSESSESAALSSLTTVETLGNSRLEVSKKGAKNKKGGSFFDRLLKREKSLESDNSSETVSESNDFTAKALPLKKRNADGDEDTNPTDISASMTPNSVKESAPSNVNETDFVGAAKKSARIVLKRATLLNGSFDENDTTVSDEEDATKSLKSKRKKLLSSKRKSKNNIEDIDTTEGGQLSGLTSEDVQESKTKAVFLKNAFSNSESTETEQENQITSKEMLLKNKKHKKAKRNKKDVITDADIELSSKLNEKHAKDDAQKTDVEQDTTLENTGISKKLRNDASTPFQQCLHPTKPTETLFVVLSSPGNEKLRSYHRKSIGAKSFYKTLGWSTIFLIMSETAYKHDQLTKTEAAFNDTVIVQELVPEDGVSQALIFGLKECPYINNIVVIHENVFVNPLKMSNLLKDETESTSILCKLITKVGDTPNKKIKHCDDSVLIASKQTAVKIVNGIRKKSKNNVILFGKLVPAMGIDKRNLSITTIGKESSADACIKQLKNVDVAETPFVFLSCDDVVKVMKRLWKQALDRGAINTPTNAEDISEANTLHEGAAWSAPKGKVKRSKGKKEGKGSVASVLS